MMEIMNNTVLEFECPGMDSGNRFSIEYTGRGQDISPEFVISVGECPPGNRIWPAPLCGAEAAERKNTYIPFYNLFFGLRNKHKRQFHEKKISEKGPKAYPSKRKHRW